MKMQKPKKHSILDNHVGVPEKSGTVTSLVLYKNSLVGVKQNKNYTVRPDPDKGVK